jgi:hypothetical protein
MRLLAAAAIVVAMVMVGLSVEHDRRCAMVPMPVPFTDADSNAPAADPDLDAFRDDHWFGARVQRTGECRHRQERNKKKGKQSILHGTLWLGTLRLDTGQNARPVPLQSV